MTSSVLIYIPANNFAGLNGQCDDPFRRRVGFDVLCLYLLLRFDHILYWVFLVRHIFLHSCFAVKIVQLPTLRSTY